MDEFKKENEFNQDFTSEPLSEELQGTEDNQTNEEQYVPSVEEPVYFDDNLDSELDTDFESSSINDFTKNCK